MANVPAKSNYTQTTVAAPTAPSTTSKFDIAVMRPLIREQVANEIIEEPMIQKEMTSARSFFNGDSLFKAPELLSDLKYGQELRVNIEKDQNPLSLFQKDTIAYDDFETCHSQIDTPISTCSVPCINTLPTFQHIVFRFDTEYAYGVRACDKNTDFWDLGFFTKQYAKSRRAEQFGRENDLWNTVITTLVNAPAQTVDAKLAQKHATHYWDSCGTVTANGRLLVNDAYQYLTNSFEGINPTVFIAREFATELVQSVETTFNLNTTFQKVDTYKEWEVPGFQLSDAVSTILGGQIPVVVMKRSPWLTTTGAGGLENKFPLWNTDATKQYVAILDSRVGYQFAKDGYHLNILPYDCDKLVRGMIDTEYVGSGVTFPEYGMVLEFDAFTR